MAVKRTRKWVVVKGITVVDGEYQEAEHVIAGTFRSRDKVTERVVREYPNFLPRVIEFHKQEAVMNDDDFFAEADFGEDEFYDPEVSKTKESNDSLDDDNNK